MRIQASSKFDFTLVARIDSETPVSSESCIKLISLAGVHFQRRERKSEERLRLGRQKLRRFQGHHTGFAGFYVLQQNPKAPIKSIGPTYEINNSLKVVQGNI